MSRAFRWRQLANLSTLLGHARKRSSPFWDRLLFRRRPPCSGTQRLALVLRVHQDLGTRLLWSAKWRWRHVRSPSFRLCMCIVHHTDSRLLNASTTYVTRAFAAPQQRHVCSQKPPLGTVGALSFACGSSSQRCSIRTAVSEAADRSTRRGAAVAVEPFSNA